jgi:PKD repeat protein
VSDRRVLAVGATGAALVLLVSGLLVGALSPADEARIADLERRVAAIELILGIPTSSPSAVPTATGTSSPEPSVTAAPTLPPTAGPTGVPTLAPTAPPTAAPTTPPAPTAAPTPGVALPVANFTATPASGAAPLTVQFTDTSTGCPCTYQWDIGAGTFRPTVQNPLVTIPAADTWDVVLTVRNAAGVSTRAATIRVTSGAATPAPTAAPTVPPAPSPVPTIPGAKVVILTPAGNLKATISDPTVDVIELASGTYNTGFVEFPARPATKPLMLRSQTLHGAVIRGQWAFGGGTDSTPSSTYITVDGVSFRGNAVADTGIVYFGYGTAHHISLLNVEFTGNTCTVNPQNCHHLYVSQGQISDILIENLVVVGPGNRTMTGFHCYHDGGTRTRITLRQFTFSGGLYGGILCWQSMTNLLIESGSISNAGFSVDISSQPSGVIRNITCSNAPVIKTGTNMVRQNVC